MGIKDLDKLSIDDIKPLTISFKKNEDELILFKWILRHSNYSGFVKDTLKDTMNGEKSNKPINDNKENKLIDMNF